MKAFLRSFNTNLRQNCSTRKQKWGVRGSFNVHGCWSVSQSVCLSTALTLCNISTALGSASIKPEVSSNKVKLFTFSKTGSLLYFCCTWEGLSAFVLLHIAHMQWHITTLSAYHTWRTHAARTNSSDSFKSNSLWIY